MKTDTYTKIVLTIIAICLVWLCAKDMVTFPTKQVQAAARQEVVITGIQIKEPIPLSSENILPVRQHK